MTPRHNAFNAVLVSIHALLAERDADRARGAAWSARFQFTRSSRSATLPTAPPPLTGGGFNSRAPRGARRRQSAVVGRLFDVSIHALLAERDSCRQDKAGIQERVSIHALLAERDKSKRQWYILRQRFQFTRSSRSATFVGGVCFYRQFVSIHALLAERDDDVLYRQIDR